MLINETVYNYLLREFVKTIEVVYCPHCQRQLTKDQEIERLERLDEGSDFKFSCAYCKGEIRGDNVMIKYELPDSLILECIISRIKG